MLRVDRIHRFVCGRGGSDFADGDRLSSMFTLASRRALGHSDLIAASQPAGLTALPPVLINGARVRRWTDVLVRALNTPFEKRFAA